MVAEGGAAAGLAEELIGVVPEARRRRAFHDALPRARLSMCPVSLLRLSLHLLRLLDSDFLGNPL